MDNNYKLNSCFLINGYTNLNWKNKTTFTSTQYYPAQLKERYGEEDEDGWINKIFWGDNIQVMSHLLKDYRGKIDLIYIDPPFDSKADYKRKIKLKGKEFNNNDIGSFEEKQYTDIWTNDEYLQFMYERLILIRELLSEDGSIYLHCDSHKAHYIKIIMDEVFGEENFLNDVIWCYKEREASTRFYNWKHDNILFYQKTKSKDRIFNYKEITEEYSQGSISKYNLLDKDGRKYQIRGSGGHLTGKQQLKVEDEEKYPQWTYRDYLDEKIGILPRDYFTDINIENRASKNRTGYPTQKPEALLERIIIASSNPGDIVFDCFMGSGTTQNVAMKLNRKFIGSDINLGSIETTVKRLINNSECKGIDIYHMDNSKYLKESAISKIDINEHVIKINDFYPTYLLQNFKLRKEDIKDWRELVDSIMIDFDYNRMVFKPTIIDMPSKNELVKGEYEIPKDASVIKVKITDVSYKIYEFKLEINKNN